MPKEYSVNVWHNGVCKLSLYVAHSAGASDHPGIDCEVAAAHWAHGQALKRGVIEPYDNIEVDVSVDASDDWMTIPVYGVMR